MRGAQTLPHAHALLSSTLVMPVALSRVSIALFRCVGLAADEALPVLLDGDHYIPMKTPLRLEKATLSRRLSFVCSPLFDHSQFPVV